MYVWCTPSKRSLTKKKIGWRAFHPEPALGGLLGFWGQSSKKSHENRPATPFTLDYLARRAGTQCLFRAKRGAPRAFTLALRGPGAYMGPVIYGGHGR